MTRFILLFILILSTSGINATHIIGGYMSYGHLTGNQYRIELIVYRDCYGGIPPFDNPAYIAQYDNGGNLITTHIITTNDSVTVINSNICAVSNLCIRRASYVFDVNLAGGTTNTFTYQRCCRSLAIVNLIDPGNAGMTFTCTIDPSIINHSPVYDHEYASFTYTGDIFRFYASADDPDGDSLVYSLDMAISGASQIDPLPTVPAPPPYANILWSPGYTMNDMLNGPVPLTIHPSSGLIYAIPGPIGYHVIACRTDEYRNGVLIGNYRREFVVAVGVPVLMDIPGTAYVQGGSTPLDEGDAWLIRVNLLDSTLYAVDTTDVINGSYFHDDRINGLYLSKVSSKPSSSYYSNHLPTYFGDVLFWDQATVLVYCTFVGVNPAINLIQGINGGGPGFVGGFIGDGANKIIQQPTSTGFAENITVVLFNSQNEPVAYDVTDVGGYFGIGNIPLGDYKIYIDRLGHFIDNSLAPVLTLTAQQPILDNQSFLLHNTWLEHFGSVGIIDDLAEDAIISVYPNPAGDFVFIDHGFAESEKIEYSISNLLGSIVETGIVENNRIDTHRLSSQVYFIKVNTGDNVKTSKFVKQ